MSQRDAALMRSALKHAGKISPERFVERHHARILFYSARTVRRWLKGDPMPEHVRTRLRAYLTSPTE